VQPPHSLWWSTLDQPVTPRNALGDHLDVDVAIVGGGFTGLWTARELKRRDPSLQIAVLEKSVCGFGASGRNGGWASAFYPESDETLVARHGLPAFRHLRRELEGAVRSLGESIRADDIDAHFVQGGTLDFARSDIQAATSAMKNAIFVGSSATKPSSAPTSTAPLVPRTRHTVPVFIRRGSCGV
jgi:glycine/D-amino acid oxidase-like deaminating enzyme